MAPSKFYEEVDFCNRRLDCKNLYRCFRKMIEGINAYENTVAQMSCLTAFAFVDKASIVTEAQKYADEIAVLNSS